MSHVNQMRQCFTKTNTHLKKKWLHGNIRFFQGIIIQMFLLYWNYFRFLLMRDNRSLQLEIPTAFKSNLSHPPWRRCEAKQLPADIYASKEAAFSLIVQNRAKSPDVARWEERYILFQSTASLPTHSVKHLARPIFRQFIPVVYRSKTIHNTYIIIIIIISNLSYDRSTASSKMIPPLNAI
jgi:hypothetical protein